MLFARNAERGRLGTSGDQDMLGVEYVASNVDGIRSGEAGRPVIGVDALFFVALLVFLRDRVGERSLEGNQVWPVDACVTDEPLPMHTLSVIDHIGTTPQHLLGVATPQGTGAAVGTEIDDCYASTGLADPHRGNARRSSSTDNDEVIVLRHSISAPRLLVVYEAYPQQQLAIAPAARAS
jgi:hypothetical protein